MAQLLFDWLNEDVGLSRKIVAFADDFKDGYMFGELLSKYHQQLNFNQFSAKGTPAAKLNNFCLLEPSMRKIGVHFNSRVVTDIMAGKETITKNLLYEMKTALEGIYRINRQNTNQLLHGTASDQAVAVIKLSRPSYEKTISATFSKAIHATIENTNEVLMKEVTQKHTSKEASYLQTMSMADSDAYDAFMDSRYREKEINRNKHQQAEEFARSWEAQNVAKWKVNQRVAHDRRNLKVKVEHDATVRKSALRTKLQEATRTDTYVGMDAFNNRLDASLLVAGLVSDESELIKTTTNVPGDKTLSLMYIDPHTQKKGLDSAQKKMKEHHEDIAVRTLAHDQRRRKFLREYDTMQMKMSQKIFNTEVIAQMLNFAGSERVEQDLMDKVISYKKIIPDNRRNRQDLMDRMAEADSARGKEWDAVEAQREVHWTIGGARTAHAHRSEVLKTAVASAERQISTDIALEVLDKLLDVVSWVTTCRQVGVFYYQVTEDPPVFTAPLPETATDTGKKGGKEKDKDKNAAPAEEVHDPNAPKPCSCREGDVVPEDIWADAAKMFRADSSLATGFQLPAPLLVTDALWPFSLSERPTCVEVDWLFGQPFQGGNVLTVATPAASSYRALLVEGTEAAPKAPQLQSLAVGLSGADVDEFVEALNVAEIGVGLRDESSVPVAAPDATDISTLYTPTWLTAVQPRHFLGETLIAVRSAVDPVPDQPAAVVDTKHIPFRAALCGVSELARKNLTEALVKQIPGLTVIAVSALVDEAVAFHTSKLAPPLDLAVDSADVAVSSQLSTFAEEGFGDSSAAESLAGVEPAVVAAEGEAQAATEPDPFIALAQAVYECLLSGSPVPDELYVALIVRVIKQIPVRNNGFLLQDFPSTKKQALLLMEAFSGINFDSRRPQPTDKVSPYAPPHPAEEWTYDVSLCGLDAIIHVDNGDGIITAFDERARARTVVASGETMYIADDQVSIKGLQVIDNAARPFLATGIDLTVADTANSELTAFCRKINLLDQFSMLEYSSSEEAIVSKARELCDRFIPPSNLLPVSIPGIELPEEALSMASAPVDEIPEGFLEFGVLPMDEASAAEATEASGVEGSGSAADERPTSAARVGSGADAAAVASKPGTPLLNADGSPAVGGLEGAAEDAGRPESSPKEKYVYQMPPVVFQPNAIPKQLADALLSMWNTSEVQSGRKSNAFFSAIRDVRYQMLQRRRAAFDGVSCLLVKLDNRQELFDQFRAKFNEVPPDMRFDPDCVAELHLQTLELCDTLLKMSETRKQSAETYTKKISSDVVVTMLQHRCRCESVAMAQSELQRFFVVLHLLFDYCKSVRGYEMRVKLLNELEATLPVTLPETDTGGKKEKPKEAKKGKEVPGALVPFREPIAAVFVPRASMEAVPEVNGEEAVDPKAKKAPAKVRICHVCIHKSARHHIVFLFFILLFVTGEERCCDGEQRSLRGDRAAHPRGGTEVAKRNLFGHQRCLREG